MVIHKIPLCSNTVIVVYETLVKLNTLVFDSFLFASDQLVFKYLKHFTFSVIRLRVPFIFNIKYPYICN